MSLPSNLSNEKLVETLIQSARTVTECIMELRRRKFVIKDDNASYYLAFNLIRDAHPHITDGTVVNYVNNLRWLLEAAEEDLPTCLSITKNIRRSARHRDTPQSSSPAAPAEPIKVLNPYFLCHS
jgi:hypothetical protein